jgi:glucose/arabinose dehydrogenase
MAGTSIGLTATYGDRHMSKASVLFLATLLAAPAICAQQQPPQEATSNALQRQQENDARQGSNIARQFQRGEDQAWLNAMTNLTKLRAKLAEAWQHMGMSPEGAKLVADAYDPELAAHMHHMSLRGKSDQEVAELLQSALKDKRYMNADQLLIDYQRQKLSSVESQGIH